MKFQTTLERDEDRVWIAECPSIPGCVSQGDTRDEAITNIREAITTCLKVRAERGMSLTIKTVCLLSLALAFVSCGTSSNSSERKIVYRSDTDFVLSEPQQPPPLIRRIRSAVLPTDTERALALVRKADLVASYSSDGRLQIDSISGHEADIEGSPAELAGLFDRQRMKSLAVIGIAKPRQSDQELATHISFLNDYFMRHGYRRVVIQEWLNNPNGRPTLSDISH